MVANIQDPNSNDGHWLGFRSP